MMMIRMMIIIVIMLMVVIEVDGATKKVQGAIISRSLEWTSKVGSCAIIIIFEIEAGVAGLKIVPTEQHTKLVKTLKKKYV